MNDTTPSSPVALRVAKRVTAALLGEPVVVGADLGIVQTPDLSKTSAADDNLLGQSATAGGRLSTLWTDEVESSRRARYQLYEELRTIPEVKQILRSVTAFVLGGDVATGSLTDRPFDLSFRDGVPTATQEAISAAVLRMRLHTQIPRQFEDGLLLGDSFGEVIHSLTEIVAMRPTLAREVEIAWDSLQRLSGYKITTTTNSMQSGSRFLTPLQMVHYAPHQRFASKYGESLFFGLPDVGRQYRAAVDVMNVLVVMAATARTRVAVQVPKGWAEPEIRLWIRKMRLWAADGGFFDSTGKIHKALATVLDYADKVWPYRSGEAAPQFFHEPAADFTKLIEVARFNQGRLYLGTGIPKALAGLMEDVAGTRAALQEVGLSLSRTLRSYQQDVAKLVLQYIARAIVIEQIEIDAEDIRVVMPMLGEFNEKLLAEVLKLRADASVALGSLGIPLRWILTDVLRVRGDLVEDILAEAARTAPEPAAQAPAREGWAETLREKLGERVEALAERMDLALGRVEVTLADLRQELVHG